MIDMGKCKLKTNVFVFQNEVKTNESNLSHTPTMQEIEDFFDEILTKTYEQEQILKEKANDAIKDNPNDALIQEKKDSTCSQSSSDSGKYLNKIVLIARKPV